MASNAGSSAPAPARKPLFKKSAYAKPPPSEQGAAIDLFSRSKEMDVIRERERLALLRNTQKGRVSEERENKRRRDLEDENSLGNASTGSDDDGVDKHTARKRRTSSASSSSRGASQKPGQTARIYSSSPEVKSTRQNRNSPSKTRGNNGAKPIVYTLDDSDGETVPKPARSKAILLDSDDEFDGENNRRPEAVEDTKEASPELEEIEEFPELVAAARLRHKAMEESQKERLAKRLAQLRESHSGTSGENGSTKSGAHVFSRPQPPTDDPNISILVSARIEGSKPLIVVRKMSQRLKDVRIAWCDRQVINGEAMSNSQKEGFFLTWRGIRLFDSSTGRSLNLKMNTEGAVTDKGDGFEDGKVHLEAWTTELFEEHKKNLSDMRRKAAMDPTEIAEEVPEVPPPPVAEIPKIKLILTAKGYEEVRVLVKSNSPIQKLINQFRKFAGIPEDKNIVMRFDGDELDPETTVEEADMEDYTKVDVYVT